MPELIGYPCSSPKCTTPVLGWEARCQFCCIVWCIEHNSEENHECVKLAKLGWDERREALLKVKEARKERNLQHVIDQVTAYRFDLEKEINSLRPGHECFNVHFLITFGNEDKEQTKWLLRVRQPYGPPPPTEIVDTVTTSEVTTLNWLKGNGIPVPGAWLPKHLSSDLERLPFNYFIYEFMPGKPLKLDKDPLNPLDLSADGVRKFVEEYGKMQIQLSNLPVPLARPRIGCLFPSEGSKDLEVGPWVGGMTFMKPHPPYFFGPFDTQKERYLAHIDATLDYISKGALYKEKIIDDYLWHLELRELVVASKGLDKEVKEVFVKHADERGDHLMVDDEGNVVAVLDWEWAYVTTKEEAFSTPNNFNQDSLYIGLADNALREAEKFLIEYYERAGRPDLADCVRGGRLYTRLERIGNYDPMYMKRGFREVFGEDVPADFDPPKDDAEWRVYMMRRYEGHEGLKKVMQDYGWTIERAEREAEEWRIEHARFLEESRERREEQEKKVRQEREEMRKKFREEKEKSALTGDSVGKE